MLASAVGEEKKTVPCLSFSFSFLTPLFRSLLSFTSYIVPSRPPCTGSFQRVSELQDQLEHATVLCKKERQKLSRADQGVMRGLEVIHQTQRKGVSSPRLPRARSFVRLCVCASVRVPTSPHASSPPPGIERVDVLTVGTHRMCGCGDGVSPGSPRDSARRTRDPRAEPSADSLDNTPGARCVQGRDCARTGEHREAYQVCVPPPQLRWRHACLRTHASCCWFRPAQTVRPRRPNTHTQCYTHGMRALPRRSCDQVLGARVCGGGRPGVRPSRHVHADRGAPRSCTRHVLPFV